MSGHYVNTLEGVAELPPEFRIDTLIQAIHQDPSNADAYEALVEAYRERGHEYWKQGDRGRAIADYSEAVRVAMEDIGIYDELIARYQARGDDFRGKGENKRAESNYSEARRLSEAKTRAGARLIEARECLVDARAALKKEQPARDERPGQTGRAFPGLP